MQQLVQLANLSTERSDPTQLLAPMIPTGVRLAKAMLHDAQAAEDAVQEASLIAWKKLSQGVWPEKPQAWFLGVVANECRNARRGKWNIAVRLGLGDEHHVAPADERVLRGSDLRRALARLPHADRLVVVLFYYLDLPLDEVATTAGISVAAARSRLYRSVRRLRPELAVEEALS
ncbi:MAG TPA: sigma-70 family RNA polymerase sigma factor [Candidatus Dormibacteraeota bacterium]